MVIGKTDDFLKDFKKLPLQIKELFYRQELIFKENWLDSRLHIKRIKELPGVYSFRITRRYRALFYFRDTEQYFLALATERKSTNNLCFLPNSLFVIYYLILHYLPISDIIM